MESVGHVLENDLDPFRLMDVIKDIHPFADQGDGPFIEPPVQGQCPVIGDSSLLPFPEVILQILRRCPQAGHVGRKSRKGRFTRGAVIPSVILRPEPVRKDPIEIFQFAADEAVNNLLANGPEEPLMLSST